MAVVIEKSGKHGIKRAYAMKIENCSSKQLGKLFDKHISKKAKVKTDKWRGYQPLMQHYGIVQEKSRPGVNFILAHRFIQGLKSWVRGIYHHISDEYTQSYLDEYCYRLNRHGLKKNIFDNLVQRMMAQPIMSIKLN